MPHPGVLHRQHEVQGELGAVIGLHLVDREGEALAHVLEKGQAAALVLLAGQAEHAQPRAIIQRGVLKALAVVRLHDLDVHLYAVAGIGLLEQPQLLGARLALAAPRQVRDAHPAERPVDRRHGQPDVMDAPQPDARPGGAVLELTPGRLEQCHRLWRQARPPLRGIPWDQARHALGAVAIPPGADRLPIEPEVLAGAEQAVRIDIGQHAQPPADRPPILVLHHWQFCHVCSSLGWGALPSSQERSHSQVDFSARHTATVNRPADRQTLHECHLAAQGRRRPQCPRADPIRTRRR